MLYYLHELNHVRKYICNVFQHKIALLQIIDKPDQELDEIHARTWSNLTPKCIKEIDEQYYNAEMQLRSECETAMKAQL